jgi:hypothetical protein
MWRGVANSWILAWEIFSFRASKMYTGCQGLGYFRAPFCTLQRREKRRWVQDAMRVLRSWPLCPSSIVEGSVRPPWIQSTACSSGGARNSPRHRPSLLIQSISRFRSLKLVGLGKSASDGWKQTQIAWIFSLAIVMLGLSVATFGNWLEGAGPRQAMFASSRCFGLGF